MKEIVFLILTIASLIIVSCTNKSNKTEQVDPDNYNTYINQGDKLANQAQGVLLGNVSKAIKKGGPEYAIEFCNLEASSIIDSLNQTTNSAISRVSAKNRNPANNLKNEQEKQLWDYMAKKAVTGEAHDTLLRSGEELVYYKPIHIALPACLKCHGTPGEEIPESAYEKIKELYPEDQATGYALNDFRGMWKIRFQEQFQ